MKTVWLTRSEPGASELAALLQTHGFTTLVWPVISIENVNPCRVLVDGQAALDRESALGAAPQLIIALSAHAVRAFVDQGLDQIAAGARCIAVGQTTAAVLAAYGIAAAVPVAGTSEGVMAMPELENLSADVTVWLLAGEGGRDVLQRHFLSLGLSSVVKLELYRRVDREKPPPVMAAEVGAVVIGSGQGLHSFARMWRTLAGDMSVPMIAPSPRVAELAYEVGFTRVQVADGASAAAVLAALQEIYAGEADNA